MKTILAGAIGALMLAGASSAADVVPSPVHCTWARFTYVCYSAVEGLEVADSYGCLAPGGGVPRGRYHYGQMLCLVNLVDGLVRLTTSEGVWEFRP